MSRCRTLRNAIRAGIAALPSLAAEIAAGKILIGDAPTVRHAWETTLNLPVIVIVYLGKKPDGGKLSTRVNQDFVYSFALVVIADSYQPEETPDAVYEAEEIGEALLELRTVKLATMSGEGIYLGYSSEAQDVPSDRPLEGGRAAIIQSWETTKVRI